MSAMLFNEFVVAATAEEAVERLSVLHRQAREALSQALRRSGAISRSARSPVLWSANSSATPSCA